jgi:hypothetical protein
MNSGPCSPKSFSAKVGIDLPTPNTTAVNMPIHIRNLKNK